MVVNAGEEGKPSPMDVEDNKAEEDELLTDIIFIGNPGTGKSTLMNCLVGKPLFESGLSFSGSGVTAVLQRQAVPPFRWTDTPGLSDAKMRDQAAQEITKALKAEGEGTEIRAKVFFVITVEAGRFRPVDILTMSLVLEAAPIKYFGIIINKCTKRIYNALNGDQGQEMRSLLFNELPRATRFLYAMKKMEDLEDEDNASIDLPDDFKMFIFQQPANVYRSAEVNEVKAITSEAEREFETRMADMVANFDQEKENLQRSMAQKMAVQAQQMKADKERLETEMRRNMESFKAQQENERLRAKEAHEREMANMREKMTSEKKSADMIAQMMKQMSEQQAATMKAMEKKSEREAAAMRQQMNAMKEMASRPVHVTAPPPCVVM